MIAHGADQFSQENPTQSKLLSRYFNAAYFAFSMGELVALTLLVWLQTHSGMDVGFGVSAAVMAVGLITLISGALLYRNKPPQGHIVTPIAQVFGQGLYQKPRGSKQHKGESMEAMQCDTSGSSEDTHLSDPNLRMHHCLQHHFSPAPNILSPTRQRHEHTPILWWLQFSAAIMVAGAWCHLNSTSIEFFYKQPLKGMQAFATAITYCSYSFGFYLSSVLVSLIDKITSPSYNGGWLSDNNLNKDRLDLFYWFLATLSFLNFLNYLFWARWYSRKRSASSALSFHHEFISTKKIAGSDDI
nr:protein NRT1/ PTR FAMILY 4.3-like [Ipomoea batatas]